MAESILLGVLGKDFGDGVFNCCLRPSQTFRFGDDGNGNGHPLRESLGENTQHGARKQVACAPPAPPPGFSPP